MSEYLAYLYLFSDTIRTWLLYASYAYLLLWALVVVFKLWDLVPERAHSAWRKALPRCFLTGFLLLFARALVPTRTEVVRIAILSGELK